MFKKNGLKIFVFGALALLNMFFYSVLEYKVSVPVTMTIDQKTHMSEDSEDDIFVTLDHSKDWVEGPTEYGIQYDCVIHNNTSQNLTNWSMVIRLPKSARMTDSWNVEYELDGRLLKVVGKEHNRLVEARDIQSFGFIIINDEIEDLNELVLSVEPVFHMTDYPVFWINLLFTIGIIIGIITTVIVDTRLGPMRREREKDKSIIVQTMQTFSNFIDTKDPSTKGHSTRVAHYSRELAKKLKLPPKDIELIYYIALLHDIGKVYIPDEILNKPGRLDSDERAIIETHAAKGAEILKDFTEIDGIADGARYHHEHYDGTGYPTGLSGENIPFFARIICVADSYDAMSSDRCYRPRLSKEEIIAELKKNSGTQFDPEVVGCMLKLIESDGLRMPMSKM
ncbi:MAG: HD domain-containing protein [Lachnospiraceae bacterium]|nr:HD domain-containing protein [Lachnospiraceae bacterium]